MKRFEISCTEEQTRKAKALGAPIEKVCSSLLENWQDKIPTAEEIIGWLETNTKIKRINIVRGLDENYHWDIFTCKKIASSYNGYTDGHFSRKDATLAAIDAALEYLEKNKK